VILRSLNLGKFKNQRTGEYCGSFRDLEKRRLGTKLCKTWWRLHISFLGLPKQSNTNLKQQQVASNNTIQN
jgi:hypothetical protein